MEYTIENFKKALELLKSDREDLNDYGKGRLEMAEGVENLILFGVGISLEPNEKTILNYLLHKDMRNLHNIVEDKELVEVYIDDYRRLIKKISEA